MITIPTMSQIIAWFGWGRDIGALLGVSAILTFVVLFTPVIVGLLLHAVCRFQLVVLNRVNRKLAYFFVNYATFPGTFIHEMAHLTFAVLTGASVHEISIFESDCGRLGHISYTNRGPKALHAVQDALTAVAPTVVGFVLSYFLLRYTLRGGHSFWEYVGLWYLIFSLIDHATMSDVDLGLYFRGFWIFILPLFLTFFGFAYFS